MVVESTFATELARVSRKWQARLDERLKPAGLTVARWQALLQISQSDQPLTQRELAGQLKIEGPTLVPVLDSLEGKGLIERRPASNDRRAKALALTAEAGPVIEETARIADALRHEVLAGFSRDELATAADVLRRIGENLRAIESCTVRRSCGRRARAPSAPRTGRSSPVRCGRPGRGRHRRQRAGSCRAR